MGARRGLGPAESITIRGRRAAGLVGHRPARGLYRRSAGTSHSAACRASADRRVQRLFGAKGREHVFAEHQPRKEGGIDRRGFLPDVGPPEGAGKLESQGPDRFRDRGVARDESPEIVLGLGPLEREAVQANSLTAVKGRGIDPRGVPESDGAVDAGGGQSQAVGGEGQLRDGP